MSATVGTPNGASGAILDFNVIDSRAEELDITKGELAEAVGVDPATVWRWRKGMKPGFDVVLRLAEVLGLTADELIGQGSPSPRPAPAPTSPRPAPAPPTPSKPRAGE